MGFTGTLLGGAIGWALGGPLGGLVGGLLGHGITSAPGAAGGPPGRTDRGDGASAAIALAVLMAAVTRSDAKTTRGEAQYVKHFLVRAFGRENAADLLEVYRRALSKDLDLDAVCGQIRAAMDLPARTQILHVLFGLAHADGASKAEIEIVREAARALGIPGAEIRRVEAFFRTDADRAYEILGASPDEPPGAVKRKYRDLVKKYHPDRVAHLGEEFRELAAEKFRTIQEAYDTISKG
ncbi:MAG: molecular chaperone DjiA [Candidatus Eisenbacteria bacterium]